MRNATKITILLIVCGAAGGWYAYSRGSTSGPRAAESGGGPSTTATTTAPGGKNAPAGVPVAIAHVRERSIPIYLDGLGTVQAFQTATVRSQVDGVIDFGNFVEGMDVVKGQKIAQIDPRTFQANYDQAVAKKSQDVAKQAQDQAHVGQDQAKKAQDEAVQKQVEARKTQDEALETQAKAKKAQDIANLDNARVNLKRLEESLAGNAVSEQSVADQRSMVLQLESAVAADEAAIQAANAAVLGDVVGIQAALAAVHGDDAAILADQAQVTGDIAMVQSDQAAIDYAQTVLSYATIVAPIDGRTGVRLIDNGNLMRSTETTGIVIITQLQPISVIFTLPQQYLQSINEHAAESKKSKKSNLTVLAVGSDGKSPIDTGELLLVDNQIDPTTGTIKLKATFQNPQYKLWPGGFVNIRLLLETREHAMTVSAPAIQQGPDGTFVFVIKYPELTVEMRRVKVWLTQDGRAILDEGLKDGEVVVKTGQDRLKNGSKVIPDRTETDSPKKEAESTAKPAPGMPEKKDDQPK